ncbi:hypothetical protein WN51_08738 [Melipona quadrifasciata]|uniref:Uncharacterized protein n=1 Tax=Melipona quadrifasciata TaxID=166423 RepID=A0A0M8ZQ86_9HYME|nr:hypothetical protein WN51_08738 [Melipona quadrifasciata]
MKEKDCKSTRSEDKKGSFGRTTKRIRKGKKEERREKGKEERMSERGGEGKIWRGTKGYSSFLNIVRHVFAAARRETRWCGGGGGGGGGGGARWKKRRKSEGKSKKNEGEETCIGALCRRGRKKRGGIGDRREKRKHDDRAINNIGEKGDRLQHSAQMLNRLAIDVISCPAN